MLITGNAAESWLKENSTFFEPNELKCKCGCGEIRIDTVLIKSLNKLRNEIGCPLTVNSGYRCPAHNKSVGGAAHSFHVEGMAVDISTPNEEVQNRLVELAKPMFGGVIIYPTFVHLDTRVKSLFWDKRNV